MIYPLEVRALRLNGTLVGEWSPILDAKNNQFCASTGLSEIRACSEQVVEAAIGGGAQRDTYNKIL
jgi:hypothetical protein